MAFAIDTLDSLAIGVVPRRIHDASSVDFVAYFLTRSNAPVRHLGVSPLDTCDRLLRRRCRRRRRCHGWSWLWWRSTCRHVVIKGLDRNPTLILVPNCPVQHRSQWNSDIRDVVSVVEVRLYRTGYKRRTSNCLTSCVARYQVLLLDLPVVRNKSSKSVLDFCATDVKILTEVNDLEVVPNWRPLEALQFSGDGVCKCRGNCGSHYYGCRQRQQHCTFSICQCTRFPFACLQWIRLFGTAFLQKHFLAETPSYEYYIVIKMQK